MTPQFSPAWQRYFAQPAAAAPAPTARPPFRRVQLVAAGVPTTASAGAPPGRPTPVDQRPTPPEPQRRKREFTWLTWQMPERLRDAVIVNLRQTLDWRAQYCKPLDMPKAPPEYTRFGLVGEQLVPQGGVTVRKTLRAELRQTVRNLEDAQPHLERNCLLAMHSVRLGQLCAELEQRGLDALEEVRSGLAVLWD